MAKLQACIELADIDGIRDEEKTIVQTYNRDDCLSAFALRQWLEEIRGKLIAEGAVIPRPQPGDADPSAAVSEWQQRIEPVIARLTDGVPADPTERTPDQQARWVLANLLDFHRREDKATWWEYFRLRDLSADEPARAEFPDARASIARKVDRACTHKPTAKCRLGCAAQRPLLGVKRTWRGLVSMSANDPKRTYYAGAASVDNRWPKIASSPVVKKGVPL
jgi:hypothetical protein